MRKAKRWTGLCFCIGVLAAGLAVEAVAAPQADEASNAGADELPVEPVAGMSYAKAAPLGDSGLGTRSYFNFSLSVLETFDDNVFASRQSGQGDLVTAVRPTFLFGRVSPRAKLQLGYRPGIQFHSQFSNLNTTTHSLAVDYSYRASKRWALSFNNRASYVPGTDALFAGDGSSRSLDPLLGAQPVAVTLRADRFSSANIFQLQYQWSLRSYVAVATSYNMRRHSGGSFVGSQGASGRVSYNFRYGQKKTIAAIYNYDRRWFKDGFGQSEGHSLLLGHSYRVGRRMNFNLSVGPSYTIFTGPQTVVLSPVLAFLFGTPTLRLETVRRQIGVAGTARFAYNFTNTSVGLSYGRRINSGGDVFGSVQADTIGVRLTQKLFGRNRISLQARYTMSSFKRGVALPLSGVDRFHAQVRYNRRLRFTDTTALFFGYRYAQQQISNRLLDHNRHMFTVGFTFNPPPWDLGS